MWFLRCLILSLALATACWTGANETAAQTPVKVVVSFSILADMVSNVGGDAVQVTALVGPNGDAHVYQPSPADARAIAAANLIVLNGWGFEGWMPRLIDATGFTGVRVVATDGLSPQPLVTRRTQAPTPDPHAWQDVQNAMVYVRNIARGLSEADPERRDDYRVRADAYLAKLRDLDAWVVAQLSAIPEAKRKVVTAHDAFEYFGRRYGVTFDAPIGLSTDSEAAAKDMARLIQQIRAENIRAVFIENMSDPRLLRQLASESGAAIGGKLYSDALSDPAGPAASYIELMQHNVRELVVALAKR